MMNRQPTHVQLDAAQLVLSAERLSCWSLEDFTLARRLARAPLSVNGRLASARLVLDFLATAPDTPVAVQTLEVAGESIELALSAAALDELAGLLETGRPREGAGRTLCLDAVEALICALFAPLDTITVGNARWADAETHMPIIAALFLGGQAMTVSGNDTALNAFADALAAKMDRLVAAPLSNLRDTHRTRAAIAVETLLGAVSLTPEDRHTLEPGGAVLLDTIWSDGKTCVAKRFASARGVPWHLASEIGVDALLVRGGHAVVPFDSEPLQAPHSIADRLELIDGERTLAHGKLAALTHRGAARTAFIIEELLSA